MYLIGQAAIPKGTMEDFKRPDHPDFMDSYELKKIEFSGQRLNKLSGYVEMWVVGEKVFEMSLIEIELDKSKWEEKYAEHFALYDVKMV